MRLYRIDLTALLTAAIRYAKITKIAKFCPHYKAACIHGVQWDLSIIWGQSWVFSSFGHLEAQEVLQKSHVFSTNTGI